METLQNPARRKLFSRKPSQVSHLRLPWVKSEQLFTEQCTQCQQCIQTCETQIITRDPEGFPRIDFADGECTFCNKCIDSCPQPLFVDAHRRINTPAEVIAGHPAVQVQPWPGTITLTTGSERNGCLATNDIFCQSCGDECEVDAITFSYQKTDESGAVTLSPIPQPSINTENCNQCGACISNCPQDAINLTVNDFSYQR